MRTYEKTHPWLTFSADLSRSPHNLWLMLGECQSKCEHIKNAPILPATADELLQIYLAKGTLGTTAIEGNTLTEQEVRAHLQGKLTLPPSKEYLGREIDNIISGCNGVLNNIREGLTPPPLNVEEIKIVNRLVLNGLTTEDHVRPGELRTVSVGVPGYRGAPSEDCEYLLQKLCDWLNSSDFEGPAAMKIVYAIIKAVLAHLYIAWIHPFADGNGRTARLMEFRILISSGVPHPATHLLSNHYNQTRTQYYYELQKASQSKGDIVPFMIYAVQGFLDGLREQTEAIQNQQWAVVWRDFIYRSIKGNPGERTTRKQRVMFAISKQKEPVKLREIADLTPQLARAYAQKTPKALARDINDLAKDGLLVKEKGHIRPCFEAISGFESVTVKC
jgi:Fic family protein